MRKIFGSLAFTMTTLLVALYLTGCGSHGIPSNNPDNSSPEIPQKGLAVQTCYASQLSPAKMAEMKATVTAKRTTKTAAKFAKTVYGGMAGGGMNNYSSVITTHTPADVQALVARVDIYVTTRDGFPVGSTTTFDAPGGVISSGNLPLNIGRYKVGGYAYSASGIFLYTAPAKDTEVKADGTGQLTLDFEPMGMTYVNVQVRNPAGNWFVTANHDPEVPYSVFVGVVLSSGTPYADYDYYYRATVGYDDGGNQALSFLVPLYLYNPDSGEFDPEVRIFFSGQNNDGDDVYGEYPVDAIEAIRTVDRDGHLTFDYHRSGTLVVN